MEKNINLGLCVEILSKKKAHKEAKTYADTLYNRYIINSDPLSVPEDLKSIEQKCLDEKYLRYESIYNCSYNEQNKMKMEIENVFKEFETGFTTKSYHTADIINKHVIYIVQILIQICDKVSPNEMVARFDYIKDVMEKQTLEYKMSHCQTLLFKLIREFTELYHKEGTKCAYQFYLEVKKDYRCEIQLIDCLDTHKSGFFKMSILKDINLKELYSLVMFEDSTSCGGGVFSYIYWKYKWPLPENEKFDNYEIRQFKIKDKYIWNTILDYCIALYPLNLPPYVILDIIDLCGYKYLWPEKDKIKMINSVTTKFRLKLNKQRMTIIKIENKK